MGPAYPGVVWVVSELMLRSHVHTSQAGRIVYCNSLADSRCGMGIASLTSGHKSKFVVVIVLGKVGNDGLLNGEFEVNNPTSP